MSAERIGYRPEPKLIPGGSETTSLRTRLLVGGVGLNPDVKPKQKLKGENLKDFQSRDYSFIQKTSNAERENTYKNDGHGFDIQFEVWKNRVAKGVRAKHIEFFEGANGEHFKDLAGRIGLTAEGTDEEIAESAKMLFDKYLQSTDPKKGVKSFVGDILNFYRRDEHSPVNVSELKQDLRLYTWIGGIFGNASTLVISEMIFGEAEISDKELRSTLLKNQNKKSVPIIGERKVNRLTDQEKSLLKFVYSANSTLFIPQPYYQDIKIVYDMKTTTGQDAMPPAPIHPSITSSLTDDEDDTSGQQIAA